MSEGDAIERYSRDQFWEQVNREFELMTPAQLRAYRKEVALWDGTLLDGLPDEKAQVVASRGRQTR